MTFDFLTYLAQNIFRQNFNQQIDYHVGFLEYLDLLVSSIFSLEDFSLHAFQNFETLYQGEPILDIYHLKVLHS